MSAITNLITDYEDMIGETETEMGEEARAELEELLALLQRCLPFVEDGIGVASDARFLKAEIDSVLVEHG